VLGLLGDAVILVDRDRRIRYLNEWAERLTGWPARKAQAKAIQDVCPLIDAATGDALTTPLEAVFATGASLAFGLHAALVARDGRRHEIVHGAMPVCSGSGEIVGAMLVLRAQAEGRGHDKIATVIPPVDLSILRDQVGDDPEVLDEFLQRFTVNLHQLMDELRGAWWQGQPARAATTARELEATAKALGALRLAAVCAEVEQAVRSDRGDLFATLLGRAEQCLAGVERYIERI
jgi:HPt (histidine-containing phosphotransfer) domain-containing protein